MGNLPGWPFVLGWIAAFFAWGFTRGTPIVWLVFGVWCVLTLVTLAVFVRWAVRARGWRRVVAVGLGLLIVAFFAQRLIDDSDDYEIERAIETAATSTDPSDCRRTQTDTYLAQRWGTQAPFADDVCEGYAADAHEREPEVIDVEIDGDSAVATVAYLDGSFRDSTVELELVKDDGDWKLNRLLRFIEFDRAAADSEYRDAFLEFGSSQSAADCAVAALRDVPDAEIVRMTLAGETDLYEGVAVRCDRRGVERALIAPYRDEVWGDLPAASRDCIERRITSAEARELGAMTTDPLGWDSVVVACDREGYLSALGDALDEDDGTVACAQDELRALGDPDLIRAVYDEEAVEDLIEGCEG
jgi:hypothetical protein